MRSMLLRGIVLDYEKCQKFQGKAGMGAADMSCLP